MKLIHLSDLHLGKRVNGFSMLEDQKYILKQIFDIIGAEQPDGVIIAGDIYDKAVPSAEAVMLFDDFLCGLAAQNLQVLVISGNHDSPERIAFGSRLMALGGVHLAPVYDGRVLPVSLQDEYGTVAFYLLPFIKPAHVRRYLPDQAVESYTDAVRLAIDSMNVNGQDRNVLITHQFVAGALRSESEELSVGGSDAVDVSVFEAFDYVALGHLHRPQNVGSKTVRYCGTPLKYSFSEVNHDKSVTVVILAEKGNATVKTIPLLPRRDLRELKGTYLELTARKNYEGTNTDDYIHITLTDEEDIPDAVGKLRTIYPNLMKLDYDNKRTRGNTQLDGFDEAENKTPLELFSEFYEKQNNQPMSEEQLKFSAELIEKIWEDEL